MIQNYENLLQREEWKQKRQEVLSRDNVECQRCGCNALNTLTPKGFIIKKNEINKLGTVEFSSSTEYLTPLIRFNFRDEGELVCKTDITADSYRDNDEFVFLMNFVRRKRIQYPFQGSTIPTISSCIFKEGTNMFLQNMVKDIDEEEVAIDREGHWFTTEERAQDFRKDNFRLQVHHKCYRKGVEIWNHDDSEYVTLCNICHMIVHGKCKIPFYDEQGNVIKYCKPCIKCNGSGIIREYYYYLNGICFNCHGTGVLLWD